MKNKKAGEGDIPSPDLDQEYENIEQDMCYEKTIGV